jgi:hypothetical protein
MGKAARDFIKPLADGLKIMPQDMLGGGMIGIGNIYFVVNTTSAAAYADILRKYEGMVYDDGTKVVHPHTASASAVTLNGLKSAAACLVEDRNDLIIVMGANGTYYIDEAISLAVKNCHMICPPGLGYDIGATNAARIQQITAATAVIAVADASVEIAGFYLKNINQTSHITLAATSYAPNIHHNTFPLIWVSGAQAGAVVGAGDGGAWGKIERNWFVSQAGGALTCAGGIVQIQPSATAAQVNHNQVTIGDTNIATVGIYNGAVKGHTDFNIFSECGGSGVSDGGTITKCVSIHPSGCAIGNRMAVATTHGVTGGTADVSYCNNKDGLNGGAVELEA